MRTTFYREDTTNPRKSYWAITFEKGHEISDENKPLIAQMVEEVYQKTTGNPEFAKSWKQPSAASDEQDGVSRGTDYPQEDINPDDIPF